MIGTSKGSLEKPLNSTVFSPFPLLSKHFRPYAHIFYKKCVNIFSKKEIKSFESQQRTTHVELVYRTAGED